ncbi:MAG: hypothetical protein ACMXYG_05485 [Candidatus Woesearchaeota archaeon]
MLGDIVEVKLTPEERLLFNKQLENLEGLAEQYVISRIDSYAQELRAGPTKDKSETKKTLEFLGLIARNFIETGNLESKDSCYCGLALTAVPKDERAKLYDEHNLLKGAISQAGLRIYDPYEAPFNPQDELIGTDNDIYDIDSIMVFASQYFTFTHLSASTGGGIEQATARDTSKMNLVFVKKGMDPKPSRMSTGMRRAITVQYTDAKEQQSEISDMIGMIQEYELGIGFCEGYGSTLIGFKGNNTVCLPHLVKTKFPQFTYKI